MIRQLLIGLAFIVVLAVAEARAQVKFDDAFVQGGLVRGSVAPEMALHLDGKPIKVGADGRFVFGFHRDYAGPAVVVITNPDGIKQRYEIAIIKRRFAIERIDGLPPKTVTPPPEWAARRKIENGRVRKGRALNTDATDWQAGFILPAPGRYSGFYGSQRILNGKPRSPHYGLDIANKTGTPVVAPAGGVITLSDPGFLLEGGIVIIDHGFGLTSTLFHLDSVDVKEGDRVPQGGKIGTIGATGRASGPHVDWRLNWGAVRLDPALVLPSKDIPDVTNKSFGLNN